MLSWHRNRFGTYSTRLLLDHLHCPGSDVDVLVCFEPNAGHGLFELVRMQDELKELFGRPVDLFTRKAIEESPNYLRRKMILDNAEVIYAA